MSKRVFAYLRVSGKAQVDKDGFARQMDTINKLCAEKGWEVARFFEEKGVSGTTEGMERPAFAEMLSLMGEVFDTVVVERADRLARDLIVSELIFNEARKAGVLIYAADSGEELVNAQADPTRILIRQLLGALAQWEKSVLVKKLRSARDRVRAANGRCEGPVPYESTAHGSPVARRIFDAYNSGNTFAAISRWLNERDIPAPRGGKWKRGSVHAVYARISGADINQHPKGALPDLSNFPDAN